MAVIYFVSLVTHSSPLWDLSSWYIMNYRANSLVTLKWWRVGDEWNSRVNVTLPIRYVGFWWWVGDECFKMNHRCNQKSHNDLQRWGWRVDECCKNSFFLIHSSCLYLRSVLPPFQVRCKSVLPPFPEL